MKLIKLSATMYRAETPTATIDGDYGLVERYLISHGIGQDDLFWATEEMKINGHDTAVFGPHGDLRFTFRAATLDSLILELQAIESVQQDFTRLFANDPASREARATLDRLVSLYAALNVSGLLSLLDPSRSPTGKTKFFV